MFSMFGLFGKKKSAIPTELAYLRVFKDSNPSQGNWMSIKEFRTKLYARCGIGKQDYWPTTKEMIGKGYIQYDRYKGKIKPEKQWLY